MYCIFLRSHPRLVSRVWAASASAPPETGVERGVVETMIDDSQSNGTPIVFNQLLIEYLLRNGMSTADYFLGYMLRE